MKINGDNRVVPSGKTILEAASIYKIKVPTLYYLKGINNTDDSGVCVVEVSGKEDLVPAATTRVREGMEIQTESPKVVEARKSALKKILAIHDKDCINCIRTNNCELQKLVHTYELTDEKTLGESELCEIDTSSIVLVRDNNKCIRCNRCINVCTKVQAVSAICATGDGLDATIQPASPQGLAATSCVSCGQCVTVCPVGALYEKDSSAEVYKALADPEKYVVAEVAPAVRVALGEDFDFPLGVDVEGKIATALHMLGFNGVFDTKFGADLTIVEEVNEFIDRMRNGGVLPIVTSCCPGWIKYCMHFYPDMLDNLSSCKSPQKMLGSVVKSYYAEKLGTDKKNIVVVSVMPCVAKKYEIYNDKDGAGVPDVDISITTRELARMLDKEGIKPEALPFGEFDSPLGIGTGAGVIFGATGGVTEAALRTAVEKMIGEELESLDFTAVRGMGGVKEASYEVGGDTIKVAVASGLANTNALLTKVQSGEADYQFIEVMACPGGCVNGGGQPWQPAEVHAKVNVGEVRANALYRNDQRSEIRKSHENSAMDEVYASYLGEPGSEKAHHLLHTTHIRR